MKDWETRQKEYKRRRQKVFAMKTGLAASLVLVVFLILLMISALNSGYIMDPTSVIKVHYSGYQGVATAQIAVDSAGLHSEMDDAFKNYDSSLWPVIKKYKADDYYRFADSFSGVLDKSEALRNSDKVTITIQYDKELANKLGIRMKYEEIPFTVEGLADATVVTEDDLFKYMKLNVEGVSPLLTVSVENTAPGGDFLSSVSYAIASDNEYYKNGDKVTVRASYDGDMAVAAHLDVRADNLEREIELGGYDEYLISSDQLSPEVFQKAVELGKTCFVRANEYGLRIFTEAGLTYTWVGTQDYTFEWSNPRILSSYVEVVKDEYAGHNSKPYNYLELVYEVHIEQANGTGCDAEAVVALESITVDKDGNVDLNDESVQLFSASYLDKNIKNSLQGWFGEEYELEKIDLSTKKTE